MVTLFTILGIIFVGLCLEKCRDVSVPNLSDGWLLCCGFLSQPVLTHGSTVEFDDGDETFLAAPLLAMLYIERLSPVSIYDSYIQVICYRLLTCRLFSHSF